MSQCKNGAIICNICGKFCIPYDQETPFGCKCYDPPEPHDPYDYCKECAKELEKKWYKRLKAGDYWSGYWQKSKAETKAAKKLNLVWLHDRSIGKPGEKGFKTFCYVTREEYEKYFGKEG